MDEQVLKHKSLQRLIGTSDAFTASLHHKSARSNSVKYLKDYGKDSEILDAWESFGKATLSLYAARLTLNLPTKKSPGTCSSLLQKLLKQLLDQLASVLKASNLGKFGPGVSHSERERIENYRGIAYQLIGAITHERGYDLTVDTFIKPLLNVEKLSIPSGKDSKTTLQEYMQRKYKTLPKYTLHEESGPTHAKNYCARLEIKNQISYGSGLTIRAAEHEAAADYLKRNNIPWKKEVNVDLKIAINYHDTAKAIHTKLILKKCVNELPSAYGLPNWSKNLLALSLTHRSFNDFRTSSILGDNNTLLAFIGSYFIQWIAHDAVLNSLSAQEITHTGGIAITTSLLIKSEALASIFDDLIIEEMLNVGPGEKHINFVMKSEFVQAFCGAVFLIREVELRKARDFFHGINALHEYFNERIERLCIPREQAFPIKTTLQEQCQSLGIRIQFETKVEKASKREKHITPCIYLQSEFLPDRLSIKGQTEISEAHTRQKNGALESELARRVNQHIDIFFGRNNSPSQKHKDQLFIDQWILLHITEVSKKFSKNRSFRVNQKLLKSNFLGADLLKNHDFTSFESWYLNSLILFGDKKPRFSEATSRSFYEYAGQASLDRQGEDGLNRYLSKLENTLLSVDPLATDYELSQTEEYKKLIDYASTYKIMGSSTTSLMLSELVNQFNLISRRPHQIKVLCDQDLELFEIQGAHLSIIDVLFKVSARAPDSQVEISANDGAITYQITKNPNDPAKYLSLLHDHKLWNTLKILLPITSIKETQSHLSISSPAIINNSARIDLLNIWWSFALQGTSNVAANDMIAAILHSLKNDILGYSASSLQAQLQTSTRLKYQFAADASGHIERALINLRAVGSLSKDTTKPDIAPVRIGTFLKTLVSSLWSWMPESITLDFSIVDSSIDIWTNKDSLHSILVNLIKNAVESLGNRGTISVNYNIDPEYGNIEFLVSDSGVGFRPEQLDQLNTGSPVKSSKKNGHGLGLLTVILLAKELNGNLHFFNDNNGHANIKVWIPSSPTTDTETDLL